jgi:hypothetical protein
MGATGGRVGWGTHQKRDDWRSVRFWHDRKKTSSMFKYEYCPLIMLDLKKDVEWKWIDRQVDTVDKTWSHSLSKYQNYFSQLPVTYKLQVGAWALHVLNLIWFGYISCLSQWGGGGQFARWFLPAFATLEEGGGGQHPICYERTQTKVIMCRTV